MSSFPNGGNQWPWEKPARCRRIGVGGRIPPAARRVTPLPETNRRPLGPQGEQFADPPCSLTLDGVVYVDNGIHYNLVDPAPPGARPPNGLRGLPPWRAMPAAAVENDYFYEQAEK